MTGYTKQYRTTHDRKRADDNYRWLTALPPPLRVPKVLGRGELAIEFELIDGHHAAPADLVPIAQHLGILHRHAYDVGGLHGARLDRPHAARDGVVLGGFTQPRAALLLLHHPNTPEAAPLDQLLAAVNRVADGPCTFYKDTNPRNVLVTVDGPVTIDFDDLTLAPFGYDLAKLIVTLAMTHGPLAPDLINDSLATYNHALAPALPPIPRMDLMIWAEVHYVLTARYLGRGAYSHGWHTVRPAPAPT